MKRLVLCCDGTWDSGVNPRVTNIEKIVRAVVSGICPDGVQQMVFSVEGVGAQGYLADRLLGGAFGYGLGRNVVSGYRQLALNYEPGDEVFVFGFSRGAYTARSVVGMIALVGLLTPEALVTDRLSEAEQHYQYFGPDRAQRAARFKAAHCYPEVPIAFLGVFDTVGALGVPGFSRRRTRFHDLGLSPSVRCARQALAIDDRRITYEPALWDVPVVQERTGWVEQVWFPGAHSDVGGGKRSGALSDLALRWMVAEASAQGLVFHPDRLARQYSQEAELVIGRGLGPWWRLLNAVERLRPRRKPLFRGNRRVLDVPAAPGRTHALRLSDVADRLSADPTSPYGRRARNIGWWRAELGEDFESVVVPVPGGDTENRPVALS